MQGSPPARRWLRRAAVVVSVTCAVASLAALSLAGWAAWRFDSIPRFGEGGRDNWSPVTAPPHAEHGTTTSTVPARRGTETFLVFSTGVGGLTTDAAEALGVADPESRGDDLLTDAILMVVADHDTGTVHAVSVPRDLWSERHRTRVNAVYADDGAQALTEEVAWVTGLPVDHLVHVDMQGFAEAVDAVGGVRVRSRDSLRDRKTGLELKGGECVTLDGRAALAFVRSRHVQRQGPDGVWRPDGDGDFGRMSRQHAFLAAAAHAVSQGGSLADLPRAVDAVAGALVLDRGVGQRDVVEVAGLLSGGVTFSTLPAVPGNVGAADVLFLDEPAAAAVLRSAGGEPPWAPPALGSSPAAPAAQGTTRPPDVTAC